MANQYGRPMKGRTRRFPITVNVEQGTLEEIDKFVEAKQQDGPYSRSDFYEAAAAAFLRQAGASEIVERNKIVTE